MAGVWQLKSVLSHRDEQVLQNYFGDVSTARANARPPMRSHIELDSDSGSSDDESEEETEEDKKTGYKGGEPTGVFTMTEAQAKAAAVEVIGTHKGLTGAAADAYLGTYWAKAWGHFD